VSLCVISLNSATKSLLPSSSAENKNSNAKIFVTRFDTLKSFELLLRVLDSNKQILIISSTMSAFQPLGLPLRDIVGTGFEHEGTERSKLTKQGWKQGDKDRSDYSLENEFEQEKNPVVLDGLLLTQSQNSECDRDGGESSKHSSSSTSSAAASNAFDIKEFLENEFDVKVKRVFHPNNQTFCFVTFDTNADAVKMCKIKEIENERVFGKDVKITIMAQKYGNANVEKWRMQVRKAKAMDDEQYEAVKDDCASLNADVFASKEELRA